VMHDEAATISAVEVAAQLGFLQSSVRDAVRRGDLRPARLADAGRLGHGPLPAELPGGDVGGERAADGAAEQAVIVQGLHGRVTGRRELVRIVATIRDYAFP
jgi:hypothetical protein